MAERVGPRQEREAPIVVVEGQHALHGVDVGDQVPVREDDALGVTRGARGVDQASHVLRVRVNRGARRLRAGLAEARVRHRIRLREREADHELDRRRLLLQLLALLEDLVRRGDDRRGLAVVADEGPLLRELGLVHRHEGGADAEAGVRGHGPLDAVVGDDRDVVAALHAEGDEAGAELFDLLSRLGVGRPSPLSVFFRSKELARAEGLHRALEHIDKVLVLGGRHRALLSRTALGRLPPLWR